MIRSPATEGRPASAAPAGCGLRTCYDMGDETTTTTTRRSGDDEDHAASPSHTVLVARCGRSPSLSLTDVPRVSRIHNKHGQNARDVLVTMLPSVVCSHPPMLSLSFSSLQVLTIVLRVQAKNRGLPTGQRERLKSASSWQRDARGKQGGQWRRLLGGNGSAGQTQSMVDKMPFARRVRGAKAAAEREPNCTVVRSRPRVSVTSPQTSGRPLASRARCRMDWATMLSSGPSSGRLWSNKVVGCGRQRFDAGQAEDESPGAGLSAGVAAAETPTSSAVPLRKPRATFL